MRRLAVLFFAAWASLGVMAQNSLSFDPSSGRKASLTFHDGSMVNYVTYERLFYVANVEDSTYQYLNVFVPDGATQQSPIFLRTYVGGYMASEASQPMAGDASGRALKEGFVLVIPGTRGRNSSVVATKAYAKKHKGVKKGQTVYTGRAPKAIRDLKAATRYLRHFDSSMPGNAERIVTDGTSAGGAMSALMGATGNNPAYEPYLKAMGAADERDDVFASVCFCPIIDLDHADMAYEWVYNQTDARQALGQPWADYSKSLAEAFPDYINSLHLHLADGTPLTADNYMDFLKKEIIRSAQIAKNAGAEFADSLGFSFTQEAMGRFAPPVNGGMDGAPQGFEGRRPAGGMPPKGMVPMRGGNRVGEYIIDLNMQMYLNYVVSTQALKTVPAFDSMIEGVNKASGENEEFGDEKGSAVNFTDFTAALNSTKVSPEVRQAAQLLNPMSFLEDKDTSVAPHWYIRHGARDRDTAFPIPVNFATKLQNTGRDVNFLLAWNRPHSGDYALDELFQWLQGILK